MSKANTLKKIIVTGANSGIGLALAKKLSARNAHLILIDKSNTNMIKVEKAETITADLSKLEDIEKVVSNIKGEIKAIVNNAGVGYKGKLDDLELEQICKTLEVNIRAPILLIRLLAPRLKADRSVILNIASSVAYSPLPGMSIYAASKSFILNWSEALSVEWSRTNRVITFSPSATSTNFQESAGLSKAGSMMSSEQVAEEIEEYLLRGQSCHRLIGRESKLINAICTLLPIRLRAKLWGNLFNKAG